MLINMSSSSPGWRKVLTPGGVVHYFGVLFTSEGKMERDIDRWIGAVVAAVMQSLYQSVLVKKEVSRKAKL